MSTMKGRGKQLSSVFDYVVLAIMVAAQWRITTWIRAYVARRGSKRSVRRIDLLLALYFLVLTAGFLLGFSTIAAHFHLPWRNREIFSGTIHFWMTGCGGAYLLYEMLRLLFGRVRRDFDPTRRHLAQVAGGALMTSPFALLGYGALVQRTDFRLREVDVPIPDLPQDLEGFRLVQLSDIHLSAFLSESELATVIDMANETRAHLGLITGDLISSRGDPLDACLRQLARLRTDAGMLGCLGNHENYARAEGYATQHGARLGIQFLRKRAQQLRFGSAVLNVVGFDYQSIRGRRVYLQGAERMVVPGAVNILLSHNPDVFPVAAQKGYDLTVGGHTHGGQVRIEILDQSINPARFLTPFVYGLYRSGKSSAYVTRGIGTIGIPARIGAPPEIALLRLRKA